MSLLEQYGSPALMRALGWTLLHSVWQGALVALTAATLLMLLHRHAAALRYRVAAGAMLILLVLSGLTFGYYYASFQAAGSNSVAETGATVWYATAPADVVPVPENGVVFHDGNGTTFTDALTPLEEPSRLQQLLQTSKTYMERNMPFVVVAWLLGMLAMTLRFLGGLAYVQRLRRYRVAALPAEWQTRLDALAARTNLRRPVQILASGLVPGPLVIGWLKPVVLLPMSAASGLSGSELEAILAHELAHVMRRDYLFNLLQSVAEILFFYHPAVWFLSGCLRTERENCCDDIATELCGDSLVLAQALASLAALQHTQTAFTPRMAMAAAGQPGSLLSRVRRLVQHRAAAPTFSDGFWAACVVLLSVGLLTVTTVLSLSAASFSTPATATAEHDASMPTEAEAAKEIVLAALNAVPDHGDYEPGESQLLDDTVVVYAQSNPKLLTKSGKAKLNEIKGLTVVVKDESGAISEVYVDGKKVPAAELPAYREALAKTEQVKSAAKAQAVTGQSQQDRMTMLSNRMASAALSGKSPSAADAEELSKMAMGTALESTRKNFDSEMQRFNESFRIEERAIVKQLNKKNISESEREMLKLSLQDLHTYYAEYKHSEEQAQNHYETRLEAEQEIRDEDQARRDADQARRDEQQARRDADQARRDADQARRNVEQARRDKERAAWHKALTSELTKDGLIRDPNNFSFSLSQKNLTADGKKQSDSVRDKYLKLYESRTGRKLSATGSMNIVEQRDSNSTVAYDDVPAPPAPPAPGTPMAPALPRVPRTPSVPRAPLAPRAPRVPAAPRAPEVSSERIREALWQDGLLDKSEKSFSLQLNSKGLIVDGKQQSAALADKYRKLLGASDTKNSKSTINITVSE